MLPLDSPRWKELRQAYGPAKDMPGHIKAMAKSTPKEIIDGKSAWSEVWNSLCHQYSTYTATYAAIPHLVSIAENGSLEMQLEALIFCGTVSAFGKMEGGPPPDDLVEPYESAMKRMGTLSLSVVREAAAQNLLARYPLPYLIQALLVLRFGTLPVACFITKFIDGDLGVETECPECDSENYVDLNSVETINEVARARDLEDGKRLVNDVPQEHWTSDCVVQIGAALASQFGDQDLSEKILNLRSEVVCSSCDNGFLLSESSF